MNIIADLENEPRDVYCGAIGYITPNNEAIFNVPIRTVLIDHQTGNAVYGVGGGVTWDSTSEGEYNEILAKAMLLEEKPTKFQLESLLLENGDYFLLEEHLKRLENSAQYFGFRCQVERIKKSLKEFGDKNHTGLLKVRLLLAKNGDLTIEGQTITQQKAVLKVTLADEPVDKTNPFLYHKTTNREIYAKYQKQKTQEAFDVLLWNQDGELTEFTNGNIVLEIEGNLCTPPVKSGLLAGTFRDRLLQIGEIHEKTLTKSDLIMATRVWFINSVRKWKEVQLI
jgi:para-aminobenzoate synthetase/4-amino-4-deoxychorismate lyase